MTSAAPEGDSRLRIPLEYETGIWSRGVSTLAGVDEVGRGPLAGPVVAAAVVLHEGCGVAEARDSKKLSTIRREALAREIHDCARAVGVGAASVREIDRLNIAAATALAVRRALGALRTQGAPPDWIVVDGRPMGRLGLDHDAVVGGDDRVHSIACASIVAKVCRDRLMRRLAQRYPAYGWARNVGYGTAEHMAALRSFGPSPHHRLTFGGVQTELDLK